MAGKKKFARLQSRYCWQFEVACGAANQAASAGMTGASRAADPAPASYFVLLKSGLRFSWNAAMPSRALAVQAERPKAL